MKTLKRVSLIILSLLFLAAAGVLLLRTLNDKKYGEPGPHSAKYYQKPTDWSLYPTTIPGLSVTEVHEKTLQGFHFQPEKTKYQGVIVCYGGSDGGPNFDTARALAEAGYETLAVFMYGMPEQPTSLVRVPLEQFSDVLTYIRKTHDEKEPITVVGASKGAEYALNLATKYPEITNVIALAPSAYNYAGLDNETVGSSWTWQGQDLPFIDFRRSSLGALVKGILWPSLTKNIVTYRNTYQSAVEQDDQAAKKRIPVENSKAHFLLLAGEDDQVWDSAGMGKILKEQAPKQIQLEIYPHAGHVFSGDGFLNLSNMRLSTGGETKANQKAGQKSQQAIQQFLKTYH